MKIRGVFSMSIINRLKTLFKGDKEESGINNDVSNTSDDVRGTSSKKVEVTISKETISVSKDSAHDLTFKKDIKPLEDPVEETPEEVPETI